jgi:hypothetical protein
MVYQKRVTDEALQAVSRREYCISNKSRREIAARSNRHTLLFYREARHQSNVVYERIESDPKAHQDQFNALCWRPGRVFTEFQDSQQRSLVRQSVRRVLRLD